MIHWGGVTCCLSAAALYLLGRSSGRDAEVLKTVTRVNQLKELGHLLPQIASSTLSHIYYFCLILINTCFSDLLCILQRNC